jgi:hypothetical protein
MLKNRGKYLTDPLYALVILAYPEYTNKELSKYTGLSLNTIAGCAQYCKLKKINKQPRTIPQEKVAFAILAYPYFSNNYLSKEIGCSEVWLEKLAKQNRLKKAGRFYLGQLEKCGEFDIIDNKFGDLVVVGRSSQKRKNNILWKCRCVCGYEFFEILKHLNDGTRNKCKYCERKIKSDNKIKYKRTNAKHTWFNKFIREAFLRGKEVEITQEQLQELFDKQNGICSLSNLEIQFPELRHNKLTGTGSVDRIDSNKPYTLDNVQWVHRDVNFAKGVFTQDYFINLCHKVAQTHPRN